MESERITRSVRDFLKVSKISMAMMQKQLYETAHGGPHHGGPYASTSTGAGRAQTHSAAGGGGASSSGLQGGVGPLAILNHKLCHDEL